MSRLSPFIRVTTDPVSESFHFESSRRVTAAPAMANGNLKQDESSDDEFYGAEDRSSSGDSEFHDAVDFQDFSSDSETAPAKSTASYRSLARRLQEESSRAGSLEAALEAERQRVRDLETVVSHLNLNGRNGFHPGKNVVRRPSAAQAEQQTAPLLAAAPEVEHHNQQAEAAEGQGAKAEKLDPAAELIVARMVAEAVGRAAGKAQEYFDNQALVEKKDRELSRIRDKLQYWERMNQEMSQQNTEAIEMLRQRRKMWRTVRRVAFASGAVVLGIGLLAALNAAMGNPQSAPAQESETSES